MASSNWVTLLAKSDTPVLLNTYNEQIHGELANQLRRSLFSANHSLTDDYIDLEALMVDSVKETQFDQVTAINLRLIGEALFKLTEEERIRYNVTPECLHMMNSLLQGMQEIPRDAMQEVNKKLRLHTPLQILKFVNKNIKELKQALSSADDFVVFVSHSGARNQPSLYHDTAEDHRHHAAGDGKSLRVSLQQDYARRTPHQQNRTQVHVERRNHHACSSGELRA